MEITYINWLANNLEVEKLISDSCGDDFNMQQNMNDLLVHECNLARKEEYPSIVEFIVIVISVCV